MTTTDFRIVIDTSTLISAALFQTGKPRHMLDYALESGVILMSKSTFHELTTRLFRKKFDRYVRVGDRGRFCRNLYNVAEWVSIIETVTACRDPEDDKFLEVVVNGSADVLVSSDADLLDITTFRGIPILSPAAFLESDFVNPNRS